MHQLTTLAQALLEPILANAPTRPLITYYDDATGARVELSALTVTNWAAKTANFIVDEVGLAAGDQVGVLLPPHWQTVGVLLGAWWAGCEVRFDGDSTAELVFTTSARADETEAAEVVVLGLDPMGMSVPNLGPGLVDYSSAVRIHADQFAARGWGNAFAGVTVPTAFGQAQAIAEASSWSPNDRVLSTGQWSSTGDVLNNLVAVFAAGASLVQVVNADPSRADRRLLDEKVTAVIGA